MEIDHGDQGLLDPSIRERLDALSGRRSNIGNDDPDTLLLPPPPPYESIDPRPDPDSGFGANPPQMEMAGPSKFPTPEHSRLTRWEIGDETETEDEQSVHEEEAMQTDQTMLDSGINASLQEEVNKLSAALDKAHHDLFNLGDERNQYAEYARSLQSAHPPVFDKSSFDTSTVSLPVPLTTQSRHPTTKVLLPKKAPTTGPPRQTQPAQQARRSLQASITGAGKIQNTASTTVHTGAMSDPAGSGNFHVSFAANNPATISQAEAVNNKHGNLSHTFAPSYISPIGSPQPTMQITSSELFKRLVKAAHTYDVAKLKYHEKSKQRRVTFLDWIHSMADVTFTQDATMHVLQNYPNLPEVDPAVNIVLSQLFRAYMERNVKPYIDSVPMNDGIGIVSRLQKVFAPTTHADFSRALQDLQDLQMQAGESVSSFMKRFHTCTTHMRDISQNPHSLPSEFSITLMFLDKLNAGVTHMDLRALLTNYHLQMQACTDTAYLPISISEIELSLADMEARLACRICDSKDHTTPYCPRNKAKMVRHPKEEKKSKANPANTSMQTRTGENIICFKCGGNHRLTNCPSATKEEIKRIYDERLRQRHQQAYPPKFSTEF